MSSLSALSGDIAVSWACLKKGAPSLLKALAAEGLTVTRAVNFDLCINNVVSVARGNGNKAFWMLLLVLLLRIISN
jgi:hypothetical protein